MAQNNEESVNKITLEYDDGVVIECEIMGVFECEGKDYIAVIPMDNSDDVYIYGYKDKGEEFDVFDIESDSEFEKACREFEEIMANME